MNKQFLTQSQTPVICEGQCLPVPPFCDLKLTGVYCNTVQFITLTTNTNSQSLQQLPTKRVSGPGGLCVRVWVWTQVLTGRCRGQSPHLRAHTHTRTGCWTRDSCFSATFRWPASAFEWKLLRLLWESFSSVDERKDQIFTFATSRRPTVSAAAAFFWHVSWMSFMFRLSRTENSNIIFHSQKCLYTHIND